MGFNKLHSVQSLLCFSIMSPLTSGSPHLSPLTDSMLLDTALQMCSTNSQRFKLRMESKARRREICKFIHKIKQIFFVCCYMICFCIVRREGQADKSEASFLGSRLSAVRKTLESVPLCIAALFVFCN